MKFSPDILRRETPLIAPEIMTEKERVIDKKPEEEKFDLPVMVSPGWGKIISPFEENSLDVIVGEGRRVLSLDFPRARRIKADPDQPLESIQKAKALLETLEKKDIDKTEGIGHSEGCLTLAIAALMEPEKFANLVFVNPAGMIGQDSFWSLAYRFVVKQGKKSNVPVSIKEAVGSMADYVLANPSMSLKEVKALSESDLYEILKELKMEGLGISLVCTTEDDVFEMEKIQKEYSRRRAAGEFEGPDELFDGFYSTRGAHEEFLGHGNQVEKHAFPKAVHQVLIALEQKQEINKSRKQ